MESRLARGRWPAAERSQQRELATATILDNTLSRTRCNLIALLTNALLVLVVLAACRAPDADPTGHTALSPGTGSQAASQPPAQAQGKSDISPLANLISAYAASTSGSWETFGAIPGVTWRDAEPVHNLDAKPQNAYSRSGKLVLLGFGDADLPNGKTGPDSDYVRGNEGESGVTLNGSTSAVTSLAVTKFYPDADYREVLDAQLGPGGKTHLIASGCQLAEGTATNEQNSARNEFFAISLPSGETIFAEGTVDDESGKYSPGSTTYFLYKEEPAIRIDSMQCKRADSTKRQPVNPGSTRSNLDGTDRPATAAKHFHTIASDRS